MQGLFISCQAQQQVYLPLGIPQITQSC
jgi:hypothetical protein